MSRGQNSNFNNSEPNKRSSKRCNKKSKYFGKNIRKKNKKETIKSSIWFCFTIGYSSELCTFLGHPEGTKIARTDVTKQICKYIKEKQLQDKSDGRKIIPDVALKSLVGDSNLTYFNLQSHMNKHFINKE